MALGDVLYLTLRTLGRPLGYRVSGVELGRCSGPAIFVANHSGPVGPAVIAVSVPVRFYPWARAELMDPIRSPQHLYREFAQPALHLGLAAGMWLTGLLSVVTVPMIRSLGCVAVESQGPWPGSALRESLALLRQGRALLVFPEDPLAPADATTGLHPFKAGFVELCRIYRRTTSTELPIFPVAASRRSRRIAIGPPAFYRDEGHGREAVRALCGRMHDEVARMMQMLG